jgi:hypothetical protein
VASGSSRCSPCSSRCRRVEEEATTLPPARRLRLLRLARRAHRPPIVVRWPASQMPPP